MLYQKSGFLHFSITNITFLVLFDKNNSFKTGFLRLSNNGRYTLFCCEKLIQRINDFYCCSDRRGCDADCDKDDQSGYKSP